VDLTAVLLVMLAVVVALALLTARSSASRASPRWCS
jgi:hypothetical protein